MKQLRSGDEAQEMKIFPIVSHQMMDPQPRVAMPKPQTPPTAACVVETGIPNLVATNSQMPLPRSTAAIPIISTTVLLNFQQDSAPGYQAIIVRRSPLLRHKQRAGHYSSSVAPQSSTSAYHQRLHPVQMRQQPQIYRHI